MDHFGRGIVKIGGKPIFVDDALPNEEIEINITVDKKKYSEGVVAKYLKKSELRMQPSCPYYHLCGGCDLMHLNYNEQLKYKKDKVKEIINKFVKTDCVNDIVGTTELYYRNKITLHVNDKIGLYKKRSYEIIPINECMIANKQINTVIHNLNNINLTGIYKVVLRVTATQMMLILYLNKEIDDIVLDTFSYINSVITIKNDKIKVIHGKPYIEEKIDDLNFIISPLSFFQVNSEGMSKIYNKALEYANINENDKVLDLYCGTGTIGIYASKVAKEVLGIELNKDAVKDALLNQKINNLKNMEFKSGDVKELLNFDYFKPTIIFVDPPRSGLDKKVIEKLLKYGSNKIIYISCDPITLARDLNLLKEKYNILEITPFDMFPNTYHVECVVLLKLR